MQLFPTFQSQLFNTLPQILCVSHPRLPTSTRIKKMFVGSCLERDLFFATFISFANANHLTGFGFVSCVS
jgi:hypothetical protein